MESTSRVGAIFHGAERRFHAARGFVERAGSALGIGRGLRPINLRTGRWFEQVATRYLELRRKQSGHERLPSSEDLIRRAAIASALLGTGAAAATTAAELFTADTGFLGGVFALPAAALAVGGDLVARTLVQLEMIADLAERVGLRIEDPAEVIRLFALTLGLESVEPGEGRGRELVSRLAYLDAHATGTAVGARLVGESLLRNVVPVLDLATSSVASFRFTDRLGALAHGYFRARRALDDACTLLVACCSEAGDCLIEGAWFVMSSDEPISPDEAALLAHLVARRPEASRAQLLERIAADDEVTFHARLRGLDFAAREPLLRALEIAAAVEGETRAPQRATLRRAAEAMQIDFEGTDVEAIEKQLRAEESAPGGTFSRRGGLARPETTH